MVSFRRSVRPASGRLESLLSQLRRRHSNSKLRTIPIVDELFDGSVHIASSIRRFHPESRPVKRGRQVGSALELAHGTLKAE